MKLLGRRTGLGKPMTIAVHLGRSKTIQLGRERIE